MARSLPGIQKGTKTSMERGTGMECLEDSGVEYHSTGAGAKEVGKVKAGL